MRTDRRARALLGALLLGASPAAAQEGAPSGAPATVVVSPNGPVRSIADGVRRVAPGGRVLVRAGTYREPTVLVDKPLTLEGDGRFPTLDGEQRRELLRIAADDVTVRGLRFARVGAMMTEDHAAVRATGVARCAIEGNRFDDTFFGVYLAKVDGCRVAGNRFVGRKGTESGSGNAIHLWASREVTIAGNAIAGHRDGIYFEFVRASRVTDNVSTGNLRYGLHFMYSDSCAYERNTFRANGSGVAVMYTNEVRMTGNRFVDNAGGAAYGLLLKEIGHPVLLDNEFARNTVALVADGATGLVARGNVFRDNGWAVRLLGNVQGGELAGNDFAGNSFDVATNSRDRDGASLSGNWFADYRGWDLDRDGRGDVPFRPVRLFSLLVARYEPMLVLQRSVFVGLLDAAERVLPSLTPAALADAHPAMRPNVLRPNVPRAGARPGAPIAPATVVVRR